jgi:hypothetical protein
MTNILKWFFSPAVLIVIAGTLLSFSSALNPGYGLIEPGVMEVVALLLLQVGILRSVYIFADSEATEDYFKIRYQKAQIDHFKSWVVRALAISLAAALIYCLPVFLLSPALLALLLAALLPLCAALFWYVFNERLNILFDLPAYSVGTTAFTDKLLRRFTGGKAANVRFTYLIALALTGGFYLCVLAAVCMELLSL